MRIFPKVTTDWEEYLKLTGRKSLFSEEVKTETTEGLYYDGVIWVSKLDFLLLLHEVTHHFIWFPVCLKWASLRLFLDIVNVVYENFYCWLMFPNARKYKGIMLESIKDAVNDWLDWILCR